MTKYDLKKVDVELVNEKIGTWTVFGKAKTGNIKTLRIQDPQTGEWIILVREDSKNPEISIAVNTYPKDRRYFAKVARLTSLFKQTKDKKAFYSPISKTLVNGRSTSRQIFKKEERDQVSKWIKAYFEIRLYGNVVTRGKSGPAKNYLVALIESNHLEDFPRFFIGTRVWPLREYYEKQFK